MWRIIPLPLYSVTVSGCVALYAWILECGKELAKELLVKHRQTQHGATKGGLVSEGDEADRGDNIRTYRLAFTAKTGPRTCPVEDCSGQASMRTEMRAHFWHRNVRDTVVILEEGNLTHLW